jgi:transcriptional regulator with XRE-family HTH domain
LASDSFGIRLKAEREGRGFTLAQIATSTKIPQTLLEALERDDLSRWPKGLYRRAFFRSYVTALGLPAEQLVLEFARRFPDDTSSNGGSPDLQTADPDAADQHEPLTLSWAGPSPAHRIARSGAIAIGEVIALGAGGGVIAWATGLHVLEGIGAVTLVYLPVSRVAAERNRGWHATGGSFADLRTVIRQRWTPMAHTFTRGTTIVAPVARSTGRLMKGTAVVTGRMSSRALATASHAFWKGVRSVAGHAELLASRQLKRTE